MTPATFDPTSCCVSHQPEKLVIVPIPTAGNSDLAMPSVAQAQSKDALAVAEKHKILLDKLDETRDAVKELQHVAISKLLPSLSEQLDLQDEGRARVRALIQDPSTMFRFYRRSRYNTEQALSLLNETLLWRIRTDLDLLSVASLHPLYVTPPSPNPPLFWINSKFKDRFGRPCGVINLRSVERTAENTLDELKEYIVACMEVTRRYISDTFNRQTKLKDESNQPQSPVLQMVIAIDLQGSGMANLELELLPFLLDLLKNHFPGMVGAVYVLHYGWVHSGMWAVAKRVLPEQALARIFFPSDAQLTEHFDPACIPKCYSGKLDLEMTSASNDVLRRYGKPKRMGSVPASPVDSPDITRSHRTLSRSNSFESMYEVFYSANGTPWASRPMTPRHSGPPTPRGDTTPVGNPLRLTPSAARKLRDLQMTQGASDPHDEERRAPRSRTNSEVRVENGVALGLTVNTAGLSPAVTPISGRSPAVRGRRDVERQVRFSVSSRNNSYSPRHRIGASSGFNLPPSTEDETLGLSDSESDASGKDGEKVVDANENNGGFLSRWRRPSFGRASERPSLKEKEAEAGAESGDSDDTVTYIDPGSPQLQVPNISEPPLYWTAVPQHTFLSQRTRKYNGQDGHVSPYNSNNPFFGYPAYIGPQTPSSQESAGGFRLLHSKTPQHLHARRRKRDLMRTLTYLFVLRVLAFHRKLRWQASLIWKEFARSVSVAGEDHVDGDRLWRMAEERHRNQRLATRTSEAEQTRKQSRVGRRPLGLKLLYALLFVTMLKPSWRQAVGKRIWLALTSLQAIGSLPNLAFPAKHEADSMEPIFENVDVDVQSVHIPERATAALTSSRSWTGLHIREKLGIKSAAAGGNGKGQGSRYRGPFVVAGGALALASLGFFLYSQYGGKPNGGGDDGEDPGGNGRDPSGSGSGSVARKTGKQAARPTMSICLSPHFDRSPASLRGLRALLEIISPVFLVHLICPAPGIDLDDEADSDGQDQDDQDLDQSISMLTRALGDVADFDTRRILEYSKTSGRWAISRALACDCHVEVVLEPNETAQSTSVLIELDKIRRSCGLVVFAALSPAQPTTTPAIDAVFDALRRRAAESGSPHSEAPAGMRAFDRRHEAHAWESTANDIARLRQSWK